MKTCLLKKWLAIALLVFHLPAMADDIDLFAGLPPNPNDLPNVLIILDNTANWNLAFTNEMQALVDVVTALPNDKFRIGLMMFTETGGGNSGNDGAYVRAAVRTMSAANKLKYTALVSGFDKLGDKGNAGKVGKAMEEAYLYFAAKAPHAGNNKNKTDYTGNIYGTAASQAIYNLPVNALPSKAGSPYVSPVVLGSCAKNYIIYISNGPAQDNSSDITQATTALAGFGGSTTTIPISPSGSQENVADEWARFMKKGPPGITTYTVDVDKITTGQGPGWTALLKSMAGVGGGKYFDVSSSGSKIAEALSAIFSEVQSINSVFASVSLPVSVNTQGTYLNQVYIGMFRPDADSFPRWTGNLKQYKLGISGGALKLLDADNSTAINSNTGFISECARSFWTPTTVDTYWAFNPQGSCLTVANSEASNYPDGNIVEKGAQAYVLRSTTTRTVKTCSPVFASCTAMTDFNTTNVSQTMLGAASTTERDEIVNWARGLDVNNENLNALTTTEMRPSVHGDVVHSRPVAINYGTDTSPSVVVFYGGNDGVLRAVNGNRSNSISGVPAGGEFWSFVAPEFYANLKRIRDNTITISFPGHTTGTPHPQPKPYAFDGTVTAYKDTSHAWIYATMRRGGRVMYAFDVSDPASPSLKWKKGCPNNINYYYPPDNPATTTVDESAVMTRTVDDTDCTSGFTGIGQTWSAPKLIQASGYNDGASIPKPKPILLMGGGYDTCEDIDTSTAACDSNKKGNMIYVLDADTGALLKTLPTERSVTADLTVSTDSIGLAEFAYAADMGGNIYRISGANANTAFASTPPDQWTITKIADLGCDTTSPCTPNRKFMFKPDIVEFGDTYYLMIGSGDREKPLNSFAYPNASNVRNYFFMVKDKPRDSSWLSLENTTCGSDVICKNSLLRMPASSTPTVAELAAYPKGWYLELARTSITIPDPTDPENTAKAITYTSTEQVVTSAITVYDVTTFSTHQPALPTPLSCSSNLGTTRVYNIRYTNGAGANATPDGSRFELVTGGGLPPSPVAGKVTLDDGTTVPFVIGAKPDSPLEGAPPAAFSTVVQPRGRVYWYIQQ